MLTLLTYTQQNDHKYNTLLSKYKQNKEKIVARENEVARLRLETDKYIEREREKEGERERDEREREQHFLALQSNNNILRATYEGLLRQQQHWNDEKRMLTSQLNEKKKEVESLKHHLTSLNQQIEGINKESDVDALEKVKYLEMELTNTTNNYQNKEADLQREISLLKKQIKQSEERNRISLKENEAERAKVHELEYKFAKETTLTTNLQLEIHVLNEQHQYQLEQSQRLGDLQLQLEEQVGSLRLVSEQQDKVIQSLEANKSMLQSAVEQSQVNK